LYHGQRGRSWSTSEKVEDPAYNGKTDVEMVWQPFRQGGKDLLPYRHGVDEHGGEASKNSGSALGKKRSSSGQMCKQGGAKKKEEQQRV